MRDARIVSRARRILGKLESYTNYDKSTERTGVGQFIERLELGEDEMLVGVYSPPTVDPERIVVTTRGLRVMHGDSMCFLPYSEIVQVDTPNDKKARQLVVHLADGKSQILPTGGGHGRFRDTFEFLRFLDRVLEDVRES